MDNFVDVFKAFFAFLTKLLKNVGLDDAEKYNDDIIGLFNAITNALKKEEE